jgi:hypothetical protein
MQAHDIARTEMLILIDKYGLKVTSHYHNEQEAYTGSTTFHEIPGKVFQIRVANYGGNFVGVGIAIGEVRTTLSNGSHMGEHGYFWASSEMRKGYGQDCGGSALMGANLSGLVWRVSAVAGKSRYRCPEVKDGYRQVDDIIKYMVGYTYDIESSMVNSKAINSEWDRLVPGWGEFDKLTELEKLSKQFVEYFNDQEVPDAISAVRFITQYSFDLETVLNVGKNETHPTRFHNGYWDCNCHDMHSVSYIHPINIDECSLCNTVIDDMPNSHMIEVNMHKLRGVLNETSE